MSSTLESLQDAVSARIRERAFISSREIQVYDRKSSDLESEIEWQIAEGVGIAVFVPYPSPVAIDADHPDLVCSKISVQVRIVEKVGTNETGLSALILAEYILRSLHWWPLPAIPGVPVGEILVADTDPLVDESAEFGTNIILLSFFTTGTLGSLLNTEPDHP